MYLYTSQTHYWSLCVMSQYQDWRGLEWEVPKSIRQSTCSETDIGRSSWMIQGGKRKEKRERERKENKGKKTLFNVHQIWPSKYNTTYLTKGGKKRTLNVLLSRHLSHHGHSVSETRQDKGKTVSADTNKFHNKPIYPPKESAGLLFFSQNSDGNSSNLPVTGT